MGYYLASITYVLVFLVQVNNYASEAKFSDIMLQDILFIHGPLLDIQSYL